MPKLSQMFPSPFLQAEDLPRGQNTIVTIAKVYPGQAKQSQHGDEPEVKWNIRFNEFRKPMTLWKNTAKVIAEALGTDDTDRWIGRRIAIYAGTYQAYGEIKPCINVDKFAPDDLQPQRPAQAPGLVIAGDRRPIPKEAMDRFLNHLRGAGLAWDSFLGWAKVHCWDAFELCHGRSLEEIPAGVMPAMKAFLDAQMPKLAAKPESRETIDAQTGEILNARPATAAEPVGAGARQTVSASQASMPLSNERIPDDDIPF